MTPYAPEEARATALAQFIDTGPDHINCSQAVVRFAILVLGHDPDLITLARYFGGGIAGMGETCGAITGSAIALGIRDLFLGERATELRPRTAAGLQEMLRNFDAKFGCRRCADLTGFDLTTPEGHDAFVASEIHNRCADYVGYMCDRLLPLLVEPYDAATA